MKKVLVSLGYKKREENIYAKPFGFHLLIFDLEQKTWSNLSNSKQNELIVWESFLFVEEYSEESFLNFIKFNEANTKIRKIESNFEFLTLVETIEFSSTPSYKNYTGSDLEKMTERSR